MSYSLVLLSDIHARENDFDDIELYFIEMERILKSDLKKDENITFLISGDLAFSGDVNQFNFLERKLKDMRESLKENEANRKIDFCILPGNHDLDFSSSTSLRNLILESQSNTDIDIEDKSINKEITKPLNNFFSFAKKFDSFIDSKTFSRKIIDDEIVNIVIDSYNSAILSVLDEKEASLSMFSLNQVFDDSAPNTIRIASFHHPYSWYNESKRRIYTEYFNNNYDFIITGHEHNKDHLIENRIKNSVIKFSNGVFNETNSKESSFRILRFLSNDLDYSYNEYNFNEERNVYSKNSQNSKQDKLLLSLKNERIVLTDIFRDLITKFDISHLNHIGKEVSMSDLYVPHRFDVKKISDDLNKDNIEKDLTIDKIINNGNHVNFIEGKFKSGKSVIAKKIFLDKYNMGGYPLLIRGSNFKKTDKAFLDRVVNQSVNETYKTELNDWYDSIDINERILIIDDVSNINNLNRFLNESLQYLKSEFLQIFLIIDDSTMDMIKFKTDYYDEYMHYTIREFNHEQRYELSEKWFSHIIEDKKILLEKTLSASKTIDEIFSNNVLIPSPETVILILKQIDKIGTESNVAPVELYDYLITSSLKDIEIDDIEIRKIHKILPYISYELSLTNDIEILNIKTIIDGIKKYDKKYLMKTDKKLLIDTLFRSRIIDRIDDDTYIFSNFSYYYYTLSKYIIEESGFENQYLETLLSSINNQHSFNSLIFYSYIKIDPYLINQIVECANGIEPLEDIADLDLNIDILIAPEFKPFDLIDDTYEETSKRRKSNRRKLDELSRKSSDENITDNNEQSSSDFYSFLRLSDLFSVMVKSYSGHISGELFKSAFTAIYNASFRVVTNILSDDDLLKRELINGIEIRSSSTDELISEEEKIRIISEILGNLYFYIITIFILRVSKLITEKSYLNNEDLLIELIPQGKNRELIKLYSEVINFNLDRIDQMDKLSSDYEKTDRKHLIGFLKTLFNIYARDNFINKNRRYELRKSPLAKSYNSKYIGDKLVGKTK